MANAVAVHHRLLHLHLAVWRNVGPQRGEKQFHIVDSHTVVVAERDIVANREKEITQRASDVNAIVILMVARHKESVLEIRRTPVDKRMSL